MRNYLIFGLLCIGFAIYWNYIRERSDIGGTQDPMFKKHTFGFIRKDWLNWNDGSQKQFRNFLMEHEPIVIEGLEGHRLFHVDDIYENVLKDGVVFNSVLKRVENISEFDSGDKLYLESVVAETKSGSEFNVRKRIFKNPATPDDNLVKVGLIGARDLIKYEDKLQIYIQLRGKSRIAFFPPLQWWRLYSPEKTSLVDPFLTNSNDYPDFEESEAIQANLSPGDVVIIPAYWYYCQEWDTHLSGGIFMREPSVFALPVKNLMRIELDFLNDDDEERKLLMTRNFILRLTQLHLASVEGIPMIGYDNCIKFLHQIAMVQYVPVKYFYLTKQTFPVEWNCFHDKSNNKRTLEPTAMEELKPTIEAAFSILQNDLKHTGESDVILIKYIDYVVEKAAGLGNKLVFMLQCFRKDDLNSESDI